MIFPRINVINANTNQIGEADVREAITAENSVSDSRYQIRAMLTIAFAIKLSQFFNDGFNMIQSSLLRLTLAGTPDAIDFSWISAVTTAPAPTMLFVPILTPSRMITPAPIQAKSSR